MHKNTQLSDIPSGDPTPFMLEYPNFNSPKLPPVQEQIKDCLGRVAEYALINHTGCIPTESDREKLKVCHITITGSDRKEEIFVLFDSIRLGTIEVNYHTLPGMITFYPSIRNNPPVEAPQN